LYYKVQGDFRAAETLRSNMLLVFLLWSFGEYRQESELATDEPSSATRFQGPTVSSPWAAYDTELLQSTRRGQKAWLL